MPTALIGERLPAFAPLATISAIRSGLRPYRAPSAIATGTISATDAMAPGPSVDTTRAIANITSGTSRAPARQPHRASGEQVHGAVLIGQREQQRHAGERQEQSGRESGGDGIGRPAADEDADPPRQGHRHHADVESRRAAEDDGEGERQQTKRQAVSTRGQLN